MDVDNSPDATEVTDDLNAFEALLNGTSEPATEPAKEAPAPEPEPEVSEEVAEAEEPESEAPEGEEEPEEKPEEQPRKRTTADRIKKLTRELRQAEAVAAEVAALKAQLEELRNPKPLTSTPESGKENSVGAPNPEKYQYGELDPQYMRDLARFEAKQEAAQLREELRKEAEQESQRLAAQREAAALQETVTNIRQAGAAKYPDFDSVVYEGGLAGEYALTQEMLAMAAETKVAPDILYYLATNPEESARVAAMSERQAAMWFGRKEAEYASKPAPTARKITQAPAPAPNLPKGNGGGAKVKMDDLNDPRALDELERVLFGRR